MRTLLKNLSLLLVLLLAGAAFARNVQFRFVFFDTLRGQPSFQACVKSVAWWNPTNHVAMFSKEGRMADKPQLWVMVTRTDGALLKLIWEDATTQHVAFARSLQVSNTYRVPDVWDEFIALKIKK
jgi:hypothetical protein